MPYPVDYGKTETLKTYLDTTGRPVLVARKSNLVDQHIQDFEVKNDLQSYRQCVLNNANLEQFVHEYLNKNIVLQLTYEFQKILLLQEPLLLVGAFYLLFVIVIIYVRLDFSITKVTTSRIIILTKQYLMSCLVMVLAAVDLVLIHRDIIL